MIGFAFELLRFAFVNHLFILVCSNLLIAGSAANCSIPHLNWQVCPGMIYCHEHELAGLEKWKGGSGVREREE